MMNRTTNLGNKNWVVWLGIIAAILAIITFVSGKNLPDFFGVDVSSTPTMSAPIGPTPNLPINTAMAYSTPTMASIPTMFPTQEPFPNIAGVWDLNFTYKGYTDSNGNFTERAAIETWVINLHQSGTEINGELLSVNSKYVDSCISASIEGSVDKSDIMLLIYFNGSCCPNEIAKIDGAVQGDKIIIGNYQPVKTPSGTCTLSTGEVLGTKR